MGIAKDGGAAFVFDAADQQERMPIRRIALHLKAHGGKTLGHMGEIGMQWRIGVAGVGRKGDQIGQGGTKRIITRKAAGQIHGRVTRRSIEHYGASFSVRGESAMRSVERFTAMRDRLKPLGPTARRYRRWCLRRLPSTRRCRHPHRARYRRPRRGRGPSRSGSWW